MQPQTSHNARPATRTPFSQISRRTLSCPVCCYLCVLHRTLLPTSCAFCLQTGSPIDIKMLHLEAKLGVVLGGLSWSTGLLCWNLVQNTILGKPDHVLYEPGSKLIQGARFCFVFFVFVFYFLCSFWQFGSNPRPFVVNWQPPDDALPPGRPFLAKSWEPDNL